MAQSWNFIGGLAGYPSFATAAFFGFGAYTSAILQNHGAPIMLAWGCAGLAALVFAALHRRRDPASARALFRDREPDRRRDAARDRQHHAGLHRRRQRPEPADPAHLGDGAGAVLLLRHAGARAALHGRGASSSTAASSASACAASSRTRTPRASSASTPTRYKTAAFSLSAVFVGMAGAIYASWVNYIEPPDVFDVLLAVKPMVMVLLGGLGTIFGPALGRRHPAGVRGTGVAQFPHHPCGGARRHHRRAGAVPAERHSVARCASGCPRKEPADMTRAARHSTTCRGGSAASTPSTASASRSARARSSA